MVMAEYSSPSFGRQHLCEDSRIHIEQGLCRALDPHTNETKPNEMN